MTITNTINTSIEFAKLRAKNIMEKSEFMKSSEATSGSGKIIELSITIIIIAAMIPAALSSIFGTNTSTWDASTVAIWGVFGVIIVAIVVLMLYNTYGGGTGSRRGGF